MGEAICLTLFVCLTHQETRESDKPRISKRSAPMRFPTYKVVREYPSGTPEFIDSQKKLFQNAI